MIRDDDAGSVPSTMRIQSSALRTSPRTSSVDKSIDLFEIEIASIAHSTTGLYPATPFARIAISLIWCMSQETDPCPFEDERQGYRP